jgi:uncharacterized protein YjdB
LTILCLAALSCGDGDPSGPEGEPVATVSVTPDAGTIAPGQTLQLEATPHDAAGVTLIDRDVSWESSHEGVATVSGTGLVTGVADGRVIITATSEGESGTAGVRVLTPVAAIAVKPAKLTIAPTETRQLSAQPRDAEGNVLGGRVFAWSSSDEAVATVSADGLVLGVAAGTATITATAEGRSGTATITVVSAEISGSGASPAFGGR